MNKYIVQPGDTLYLISKKLLGDGSRYMEFLKWNPQIIDPNKIGVGDVILYPAPEAAAAPYVPASTGVQIPVVTAAATGKPSALGMMSTKTKALIGAGLGVLFAVVMAARKPQARRSV